MNLLQECTYDDRANGPYYPEIEVQLTGKDGNALNLMSIVRNALRRAHVPAEEVDEFLDECMSGDYQHLLTTCMQWVSCS